MYARALYFNNIHSQLLLKMWCIDVRRAGTRTGLAFRPGWGQSWACLWQEEESLCPGLYCPPTTPSRVQPFSCNPDCEISVHSQPLALCSLGFSMCPARVTESTEPGKGLQLHKFPTSKASKEFPDDANAPGLHLQKPGPKIQGTWRTWDKLCISVKRSRSTPDFQSLYFKIIFSFALSLSFVQFETGCHLAQVDPELVI